MTIEKYFPIRLLRPLEVSIAAVLVVIGSFVAFFAVRDAIAFISDFIWRLSKGYLEWEMQLFMGAYILSLAMFASLFYIFAYALYRGRWSRTIGKSLLWVSVVGAVSFIVSVSIFFVGFWRMGAI